MLRESCRQFRPALVLLAALTILPGVAYPAMVTGIAQLLFPHEANGSLVVVDGQVIGSELVGQPFAGPGWFHGRPSATSPYPYNAASSAGSNLGPSNPDLVRAVADRIAEFKATGPAPADLVTASGSGLDPHVSPAAAMLQAERVARETGLSLEAARRLVEARIEPPQLGFLGEARVNVLLLELALRDMRRAAERAHGR